MTALAFTTGGCGYLDVDPELGLEDKEVFGTYSNFRSYFDSTLPEMARTRKTYFMRSRCTRTFSRNIHSHGITPLIWLMPEEWV